MKTIAGISEDMATCKKQLVFNRLNKFIYLILIVQLRG